MARSELNLPILRSHCVSHIVLLHVSLITAHLCNSHDRLLEPTFTVSKCFINRLVRDYICFGRLYSVIATCTQRGLTRIEILLFIDTSEKIVHM